uniref:RNA-binding protein squid (inferred by orthology to a D. melanogaster protein) n=1 Tax=Strongyloides venezuelensis TaxID=75913 RepID=A0A0K0FJ23_STRVS
MDSSEGNKKAISPAATTPADSKPDAASPTKNSSGSISPVNKESGRDSSRGNTSDNIKSNGPTSPGNKGQTKGNEDKKIFVGGIPYDISNEELSKYFARFGPVAQVQVKYDRLTNRSRGFAFVEFETASGCANALNVRVQNINDKTIEVKPAKSRENKKVFVGGLPSDFPEADLKVHFEKFGKVEDIEWPFDKTSKVHKNFAFVVFEEEAAADRAAAEQKQMFGVRECDVKKAVPQGKRFVSNHRNLQTLRNFSGAYRCQMNIANPNWYPQGWNGIPSGPIPNYNPAGWAPDWYQNTIYPQNGSSGYGGYQNNGNTGYENYASNGGRNNQRYQQTQFQ